MFAVLSFLHCQGLVNVYNEVRVFLAGSFALFNKK